MTTMNLKKMKPKSNLMMNRDEDSLDEELFLENDFGTQFPEQLSPDILELLEDDY